LLIVIAMSLSALARIRFVLCDKFAAARSDHLSGGEYGLLQVEAVAPGPKETQFGGALRNWLTRLNT